MYSINIETEASANKLLLKGKSTTAFFLLPKDSSKLESFPVAYNQLFTC